MQTSCRCDGGGGFIVFCVKRPSKSGRSASSKDKQHGHNEAATKGFVAFVHLNLLVYENVPAHDAVGGPESQ